MLLGCFDIAFLLPVSMLGVVGDARQGPISFWPGWSTVHSGFSEIPMESSEEWRSTFWDRFFVRFNESINVIGAFLFFILFGLTADALANYRHAFWAIVGVIGLKPGVEAEATMLVFKTRDIGSTGASNMFVYKLIRFAHYFTDMKCPQGTVIRCSGKSGRRTRSWERFDGSRTEMRCRERQCRRGTYK